MRYLSQRFAAPNRITAGTLTDVGRFVSKRLRFVLDGTGIIAIPVSFMVRYQ